MRSAVLAAIVSASVLLCLCIACSSGDSTSSATRTALSTEPPAGPRDQPAPAQQLDPQAVEPQDGVIEITASGQHFEQNYLRIPLGQSVTIRLTNNDNTQHSLRIAGLDGQFNTEDDAVTNPPQITGGGGVGELTFAPLSAGAYTFRCDFHPTTMGGQIVVGDATPGSAPTASPAGSPQASGTGSVTPTP
ncbi:MAG TPA: cupredoxin domain-containing protein [Dehalococcoidia bacterium]